MKGSFTESSRTRAQVIEWTPHRHSAELHPEDDWLALEPRIVPADAASAPWLGVAHDRHGLRWSWSRAAAWLGVELELEGDEEGARMALLSARDPPRFSWDQHPTCAGVEVHPLLDGEGVIEAFWRLPKVVKFGGKPGKIELRVHPWVPAERLGLAIFELDAEGELVQRGLERVSSSLRLNSDFEGVVGVVREDDGEWIMVDGCVFGADGSASDLLPAAWSRPLHARRSSLDLPDVFEAWLSQWPRRTRVGLRRLAEEAALMNLLPLDPERGTPSLELAFGDGPTALFAEVLTVRLRHAAQAPPRPVYVADQPPPAAVEPVILTSTPLAGSVAPPPSRTSAPPGAPLAVLIHLADLHVRGEVADPVLHQIRVDAPKVLEDEGLGAPDAVLVAGNLTAGGSGEVRAARLWLDDLASMVGAAAGRVFVVPGSLEHLQPDRATQRLLNEIRANPDAWVQAFADEDDRARLLRRTLPFAAEFPWWGAAPSGGEDLLFRAHAVHTGGGLRLRVIGLNTALLSLGFEDKGKLRVGDVSGLFGEAPGSCEEIVALLGQHPLREGWLADQDAVNGWVEKHDSVYLSGAAQHMAFGVTGGSMNRQTVHLTAGAVHSPGRTLGGELPRRYNIAAIYADDPTRWKLRVWPRAWEASAKMFLPNQAQVRGDASFVDYPLQRRARA